MVLVHIRADKNDEARDEFLFETRCTQPLRDLVEHALELVALRAQLRSLAAARADVPAALLEVLSPHAIRQKRLSVAHALREHVAAATPSHDDQTSALVRPELVFASRTLPADDTPLSKIVGTNEKSKVTFTLRSGGGADGAPAAAAPGKRERSVEIAGSETLDAAEVSLLKFVKRKKECAAAPAAADANTLQAAGAHAADEDDEDEERPRLTSEQLARLCACAAVRDALRSEELRRALTHINSSATPERELDKAMHEPAFATFVRTMLVSAGVRAPDAE